MSFLEKIICFKKQIPIFISETSLFMAHLRGEQNLTPNRQFKMLLNACLLIFSLIFAQIII